MTGAADRPGVDRVRSLPGWARLGSVVVRTVHLTSCAAILGGQLGAADSPGLGAWWIAAGLSGVLLMGYEGAGHPGLWRLLAGWVTIFKLLMLGAARLVPALSAPFILTVFVIAGLGAHLPRRWRHQRII